MTGQKEEKKENEKEEKEEKKEEKKFLRADRRTDQSKVVQEVLADPKWEPTSSFCCSTTFTTVFVCESARSRRQKLSSVSFSPS